MNRLVAPFAAAIHMVFVAFTVVGGFVAFLVPWLLLPHLAVAAWGGRMAITRAACPLSRLENWGRTSTGRPELDERGFIAHYFEKSVYPARWARRVEFIVGGLIIGSWLGLALK